MWNRKYNIIAYIIDHSGLIISNTLLNYLKNDLYNRISNCYIFRNKKYDSENFNIFYIAKILYIVMLKPLFYLYEHWFTPGFGKVMINTSALVDQYTDHTSNEKAKILQR